MLRYTKNTVIKIKIIQEIVAKLAHEGGKQIAAQREKEEHYEK